MPRMTSASELLASCSTYAIRAAIGYLTDEAHMFDADPSATNMLDAPVYLACVEWMRAEIRVRKRKRGPVGKIGVGRVRRSKEKQ